MNILIAIGGKEYSKPTLDLGMKVANAFEATTTIAYVGKKISQFSEKDVSVVHQNLDDRELYRPGVRTLEWAYDFLESRNYINKKDPNITFNDHLIIDEENSRMRVLLKGSHSNKIDLILRTGEIIDQLRSEVELIDQDEYYKNYEQVFGDTAKDNKDMFNDYGQSYDRQSFRKDFNKELTYKLNPIKKKIEQMKGLH